MSQFLAPELFPLFKLKTHIHFIFVHVNLLASLCEYLLLPSLQFELQSDGIKHEKAFTWGSGRGDLLYVRQDIP